MVPWDDAPPQLPADRMTGSTAARGGTPVAIPVPAQETSLLHQPELMNRHGFNARKER
jgi:hypothetical protein